MPAPAIQTTRGAVTHTLVPIPKDGWEIRGTVSQSALDADWVMSVSLYRADVSVIADEDESATFSCSTRIPFNEAPNEAAMQAELQKLVDYVFDNRVPTP